MYYPTLENIELIIKQMNKRYNMDVVIINKGQLEFALEKPKTKLFGEEQYPELYQKAAILMETITKIHTLSDGNKRTAMMTAEFMIKANGGELILPLKTIRLSVDTAMDASDSMSELIQQWFKVHTAMNVHQLCAILYEHIEEEFIIKKLWDDKKYSEVESLIERWMAFDSYPENRKAWNELSTQWQKNKVSIEKKSTKNSEYYGWYEMWGSIMGMAKRDHEQYADYFDLPIEKITELQCNENNMTELKNMEKIIQETANTYEKTTDPEIIHQNGMILARHGNTLEAISQFEKLRKYDKDESDAIDHIAGLHYYQNKDAKSALEYWKIYEKYRPDSLHTVQSIGFALTTLEQYSDALGYLETALKKDTKSEKTLLFMGMCYDGLKQYEKAISCFKKCISIDPKSFQAHSGLASAYAENGQFAESLEYHDKTIELDPDNFHSYYNKGRFFHSYGKLDEAIIEYEKTLKMEPDNLETIINMGSALSDSGKREDAIPYFENALKQDPDHPVALASLGITLIFLKRFDDAFVPIERQLKLDPTDNHAKMSHAIIFANTGKILESLTILEELVTSDPDIKDMLRDNPSNMFNPIKDSERFKKLLE